MAKNYSGHVDTRWIEDNTAAQVSSRHDKNSLNYSMETDEEYQASKSLHYKLLAQGGFERVSNNIIALMNEYTRGWSFSGMFRSGNPFHGMDHTPANVETAKQLTLFCSAFQNKNDVQIQKIMQTIMMVNGQTQAEAFINLFTNCTIETSGKLKLDINKLIEFFTSKGITGITIFGREDFQANASQSKEEDAYKIHGILSVVQSLFKPKTPIGKSSFNDRVAWILKRELCLTAEVTDAEIEKKQNTTHSNGDGAILEPPSAGTILLEMFKARLSSFWGAYVDSSSEQTTTLHAMQTLKLRNDIKDPESKEEIEIDLDEKVDLYCVGGLSFWSFGMARLSLRQYLDGLAVRDEYKPKAEGVSMRTPPCKYEKIMQVLNDPNPSVSALREALSLFRYQTKEGGTNVNVLAKRETMTLIHSKTAPAQTTGERILEALLKKKEQAKKEALKRAAFADAGLAPGQQHVARVVR